MSARSGLAAVAVGLLLAGPLAAGCANLPTSGSVRLSKQPGSGGGTAPIAVQFLPAAPGPNWHPKQIVRGFLAASASFAHHHAVARQYLTATYAKRWRPGWAATVIGNPTVNQAALPRHNNIPAGGALNAYVNIRSQYVAKMTTAVKFGAGNVVVSAGPSVYQFALTNDKGQWRINGITLHNEPINRSILLLTQPDFERDYQPRNLYYFPKESSAAQQAGLAEQTLIPEPVYVPLQGVGIDRIVGGLVSSLRSPPGRSSWLSGAATTAMPPGTKVLGVRVVGGIKAIIDLGGKAATASAAQRNQMAAQLYETLTSSPYTTPASNQIHSVVLELNHRVWRQPLPPPYASWVPRVGAGTDPSPLYFQAPGGSTVPDVQVLDKNKLAPTSMNGGLSGMPFTAIAATQGPVAQSVVAGCVGTRLYLEAQWPGAQLVTKTLAAQCTSLSWDVNGNLWLTAGKDAWVLRGAGRTGILGSPARVYCPACHGAIIGLRVAPDGVRVGMIVTIGKSSQVMVGAISGNSQPTYLGQEGKLVRVGSDIANPGALAWLDPDHLLILDHAGEAGSDVYEVPLNGGTSTQIAAPRHVAWLTASWPQTDSQPRLIVGIGGKKPQILTAIGGLLDRAWVRIAKGITGITPVYPG